ncbi:MAG: hypothetical protein ACJ752_14110 [Gaiellaceae bacterium]
MKALRTLKRRYPTAFGIGLGIFLAAGAAAAAFVIYSLTIGGTDTGQFAAGTTQSAVSITPNGTPPALDSGTTVNMPIKATNVDPNAQHKILTLGGTITTKNSSGVDNTSTCASFLTLGTSDLINVQLVLAGTATGIMPVTAAAGTPSSCAAGSYTVAFNGTTN